MGATLAIARPPALAPSALPGFRALRVVPARAASLAFRIALPRGWAVGDTVGEFVDAPWVQRPLAVFVANDAPSAPRVTVTTTLAPHEIRIEDWVRRVFVRSRWMVEHQVWHETAAGSRLISTGVRGRQRRATVAFADGGRVFMIHCTAERTESAVLSDALWWTGMTMRLERPAGPEHLEARARHVIGRASVMLPWSWSAAVHDTRSALVARPHGEGGPRLSLHVGGPAIVDADVHLRRVLARLTARGWAPARTIATPEVLWQRRPEGWELRSLQARARTGEVRDLRVALGRCGESAAQIVIVGDAADERGWWRACRALEIAVETLA